jgi:murein L,D-transpeptidase YafK
MLQRVCVCLVLSACPSLPAAAYDELPVTSVATALTGDAGTELPMADRVKVYKSQRKLLLLRGSSVVREYNVHLGLRPEGAKQYEGDYRTPEGHYFLAERNPNSNYFLSIQISYPNERDAYKARKFKQKPGGLIMIHGLPNVPSRPLDYYQRVDWTDGCIALNNSDMVEVWLMTRAGLPIDIYP